MEFVTQNSTQTKKSGKVLGQEILKIKPSKNAFFLCLQGELGGGKTTFLQGLARGLGIKENILSPTFIIMKRFNIQGSRFKNFYHIDCYRIEKPKEILSLGFKEIIKSPQNIIAIEWAERIKKIIPQNATWIRFEFVDKKKRRIIVKNPKS